MSYSPEALPSPQPHPGPQVLPGTHTRPPRGRWPRWAIIVGVLALLIGLALAALVLRWPYSPKVLVPAMHHTFHVEVKIQRFRRVYFPHPGCEAEFATLARPEKGDTAPLVTIQKMIVTGRYTDFLFRPHHFGEITLDGLTVRIPPRSERQPFHLQSANKPQQLSKISIRAVNANGAILEFERETHKDPLKVEIHRLHVESIAAGQPMSYQLSMGNPEPPGELESQGGFGPWQPGHVEKIPLHGTVKLTNAKLDKYHGIGGFVQSEEKFRGTLDHIYVSGEATVRDFQVKTVQHPVLLKTQFQVLLDAMKGEVRMRNVVARIGQTTAHVEGSITKDPQQDRRETALDFSIRHGRAEDLLWFFNSESKVAMLGVANCSGHVRVPKFGPGFLENLALTGRFEVSQGHFEKETQAKTNELSARAQGKKLKDAREAPEVAVETLASDVAMQQAVAHLTSLYFEVPGANARMHGTYNFLTHEVDLHGDLRTQAALSRDTSGIKAVLLKPLDPLFRKKHAGAQIPVLVDGSIHDPHFGIEIPAK